MIILNNNYRTIKLSVESDVKPSMNRRDYKVVTPEIICSSRTDAEKMQTYINNFVYNLSYEILKLSPKLTLKEAELAEVKEETNTKKKEK